MEEIILQQSKSILAKKSITNLFSNELSNTITDPANEDLNKTFPNSSKNFKRQITLNNIFNPKSEDEIKRIMNVSFKLIIYVIIR